MPNRSKQKGDRAERQIVELLRAYGLDAYRVPLSGAALGFKDDIEIRFASQTLRLESKVRQSAFKCIYRWLKGSDGLVIKADREAALIVLDLGRFVSLLSQIPRSQAEIATDKPSPNPLSDSTPQELLSVSKSPYPTYAIPPGSKVYINAPRMKPLAIAPERYDDTATEGGSFPS